MGCPASVKVGQRWRYYKNIVEVTVDDRCQLHGRVVAILPGSIAYPIYPIGKKDFWVSDVNRGYGGDWEYLEGQDAPVQS